MSGTQDRRDFADGPAARVLALLLILAALAVIAWHHRDALMPRADEEVAQNRELENCIALRTGQVRTMHADGLIDEAKARAFHARAVQFCEQQFPPAP